MQIRIRIDQNKAYAYDGGILICSIFLQFCLLSDELCITEYGINFDCSSSVVYSHMQFEKYIFYKNRDWSIEIKYVRDKGANNCDIIMFYAVEERSKPVLKFQVLQE